MAPRTSAATLSRSHAVLAYGDHILTIQPHPEIEAGFMSYLLRLRGTHLSPKELEAAIAELSIRNDAQRVADWIAEVLRGTPVKRAMARTRDGCRMTSVSDLRSKLPEVAQLYLEGRPSTRSNASSPTSPAWRAARRCPARNSPRRRISTCPTRSSSRPSPATGPRSWTTATPNPTWS
jgi:hypothetical protein